MNFFLATVALHALLLSARAVSFSECSGTAKYMVTFLNFLSPDVFEEIPDNGLVFSPLSGVSHSGRVSFFTVRGFANKETEAIAETGDNGPFLSLARSLQEQNRGVKTVVGAGGPTMPGMNTSLLLEVDCKHSFVSMLGMIAPSPDWIVQINNRNLYDTDKKKFISFAWGNLIAYDAGVDDGRDFTPPLETSLDLPTEPQQNIAPLVEDETDRFDGRPVGIYTIKKVE